MKSPENPQLPVSTLPKISRRAFCRIIAAVSLTPANIFKNPQLSFDMRPEASSLEAGSRYNLDWYWHFKLIDENKSLAKSREEIDIWDKMKSDLEVVVSSYEPILNYAMQLIELNEKQEQDPTRLSIKKMAREVFLGKTSGEFVTEEDVIPFYADRNYIVGVWKGSKSLLEFSKKYQSSIRGLDLFTRLLASFLDREAAIFSEELEPEVENLGSGFVILPDIGVRNMTPEGRKKFIEHQALVYSLVEDVPFIKKLPVVFRLISADYGDVDAERLRILGQFRPVLSKSVRKVVLEIVLNMDQIVKPEDSNPYPAKLRGHHELGHLGGIFSNRYLNWFLPPEYALERFRFELQILRNSDWGGAEKGLGVGFDIFTDKPHPRNNAEAVQRGTFDTRTFVGYCEEYPFNVITNGVGNGYREPGTALEKFRFEVRQNLGKDFLSMIDPQNQLKEYSELTKLFGPREAVDIHKLEKMNMRFGEISDSYVSVEDEGYSSLDEYLESNKTLLEEDAKAGSLDAIIKIMGLAKHQRAFNNTEGLWDGSQKPEDRYIPGPGKNPGYVYKNYLQFLTFAILYDAVVNNDQTILRQLPYSLKESVVRHFIKAKIVAVAESWAEKSGFAHFLGARLKEKVRCPYLKGWEHLAYILPKIQ